MKTSRAYLFALLILALGALHFFWGANSRSQLAGESNTDASGKMRANDAPEPRSGSEPPKAEIETSTSRHPPPLALPDSSLPLREQIPALRALAEAGNSTAACRLTLEVAQCRSARSAKRLARQIEHALAGDDAKGTAAPGLITERFVPMVAGLEEQSETVMARCDGVAATNRDAGRFLVMPPGNFSQRQRTIFALLRPDGIVRRLPRGNNELPTATRTLALTPVYPQILADHALAYLEEGILVGDPLALEGMILTHAPTPIEAMHGLSVLSLPNPRKFAYYTLVMQRVMGHSAVGDKVNLLLLQVLGEMTVFEREALERAADVEAKRWNTLRKSLPVENDSAEAGEALQSRLCS